MFFAVFTLIIIIVLGYIAYRSWQEKRRRQLQSDVKEKGLAEYVTAMLDVIPDLVWMKDEHGNYLSCNRQFERLYQTSREDILGKNDYAFVDKATADFFRENDLNAMHTGKPVVNEEWLNFPPGQERLFETIKSPMYHDNLLIGVLGIARDITEHRKREDELRQADLRLKVALNSANIGVWDWDIASDRALATPVYYSMLGYEPQKYIIRAEELEKIHPDDREHVRRTIQKVLDGKTNSYDYEARIRHADGHYMWIAVRCKVTEYDPQQRPKRMLGVRIDIDELKTAQQKVEWQAFHDTLTGLHNRAALDTFFLHWQQENVEDNASLALVFIDLDRFKNINDTFGHTMGDKLLRVVASKLTDHLPEEAFLSRQGGDEFIIALPDMSAEKAESLVVNLLAMFSQTHDVEFQQLVFSASVGISIFPQDGDSLEALYSSADMAMYQAKAEGRNTYKFYSETMQSDALRTLKVEQALRFALENNEFSLHFQPQMEIATGTITGAEVLLRWHSKSLGNVSPGEFIPIAEESGQIMAIGEWVMQAAMQQFGEWRKQGAPDIVLSINLSMLQFRNPLLTDKVASCLSQYDIPPSLIELELTERVGLNDPDHAIAIMQSLRSLGVKLAIDDFGTGYSSMNYLKRFPVNTLKIDQSFIRNMVIETSDAAIVSTIIALANNLGMQTTAEGVETEQQFVKLTQQGCDFVQGYWIGRPVPADEFEVILRDHNAGFRATSQG